jgi:hypothetical protein
MFAGIERENRICIIRFTGRRGLKAVAVTWCNDTTNAGDGVVQVPSSLLQGGSITSFTPDAKGLARQLPCCDGCKERLRVAVRP